jgi:uncharacterized phosphosugar-binding protein
MSNTHWRRLTRVVDHSRREIKKAVRASAALAQGNRIVLNTCGHSGVLAPFERKRS